MVEHISTYGSDGAHRSSINGRFGRLWVLTVQWDGPLGSMISRYCIPGSQSRHHQSADALQNCINNCNTSTTSSSVVLVSYPRACLPTLHTYLSMSWRGDQNISLSSCSSLLLQGHNILACIRGHARRVQGGAICQVTWFAANQWIPLRRSCLTACI